MVEVLLADNQDLILEGLKAIMAGIVDIRLWGSASDAAELEQLMERLGSGVLIIDPNYSKRFTLGDLKKIRSRFKLARILVLSNRQSRSEIQRIINSGIKNYVSKECSRAELVNAIYSTAKGEQYFCKHTFEVLFGSKLLPEKEITLPQLSTRETELVRLIAEGLTNNEIAERLFLSVHTIKTHRKNIIKKLGFSFKNTAELSVLLQNY